MRTCTHGRTLFIKWIICVGHLTSSTLGSLGGGEGLYSSVRTIIISCSLPYVLFMALLDWLLVVVIKSKCYWLDRLFLGFWLPAMLIVRKIQRGRQHLYTSLSESLKSSA